MKRVANKKKGMALHFDIHEKYFGGEVFEKKMHYGGISIFYEMMKELQKIKSRSEDKKIKEKNAEYVLHRASESKTVAPTFSRKK